MLYARDHSGKEVIHETGVEPEDIADYICKEPSKKLLQAVDEWKSQYSSAGWGVERNTDGFTVYDPNGDTWMARNGKPEPFESEKEAKDFIDSMMEQDRRTEGLAKLRGIDLKVGGEWANALYDRAIVNFLNRYWKKWGAKVGETQLVGGKVGGLKMEGIVQERSTGRYQVKRSDGDLWGSFRSETEAKKAYNEEFMPEGITVHSIPDTPAMKHSLLKEGQPIARNKRGEKDEQLALASVVGRSRSALGGGDQEAL